MSKGMIVEAGFRNLAKAVERTAVKDTKLMEAAIRKSGIAPKALKEIPKDAYVGKAMVKDTANINTNAKSFLNNILQAIRNGVIKPKSF